MDKAKIDIPRGYLSAIGRRGGKKSRRHLSSEDALEMTRVREAKRAYKKHHSECFWSYDPDLVITRADVQWVAEQLMKNGSRECWEVARRLCP